MVLAFSTPLILIALVCFIVCYKYFFRKRMLVNAILDFFAGIMVLFMSTNYFTDQIPHSGGQGGVMLDLLNFILFIILYIVSTVALYWKRSKMISIWIPAGLYTFYIMYVFFFFEFAKVYRASVLCPVFLAFFPIYIYNYLSTPNKQ